MTGSYPLTTRVRHGFAKRNATHSVYNSWLGMRQRCYNPRNREYPNHGGRGIIMCERWRDSFLAFFADVGERPDGCTLDRIDNDRGYEPSNVRWASVATQNRNTRSTRLSSHQVSDIHRLHAAGWAKKQLARHYKVAPKTVRQILNGKLWVDHTATGRTPSQNPPDTPSSIAK